MKSKREFSKAQHRRVREIGAMAYERELSAELSKLETEFGRWRAGEIDAYELSERIHRFHQGPARRLFSKYDHSNRDFAVADAIRRGLITEAEAGGDVIEMLRNYLDFLRDRDNDDSAQLPGPLLERK
jgi:hypothetical protein